VAIDVVRVSDSDFRYSGERQRPGMTYIVSWPIPGGRILKAGVSDYPARWRKFVAKGAELHALWRGAGHVRLEQEIHRRLSATYPCAFPYREDAQPYLGSLGGWMECYAVPESDLSVLLEEVESGLVQGG